MQRLVQTCTLRISENSVKLDSRILSLSTMDVAVILRHGGSPAHESCLAASLTSFYQMPVSAPISAVIIKNASRYPPTSPV